MLAPYFKQIKKGQSSVLTQAFKWCSPILTIDHCGMGTSQDP